MSAGTDHSQAVEMRGISMHFGSLVALDDVDLSVRAGEVHALLGGNGAGKSTLLKILNGVYRQTAGDVTVFGAALQGNSPELARAAGVAMNFQEMSLIPSLTAAQNIFLNHEFLRSGLINEASAVARARELFEQLNVDVDPTTLVSDLSPGQRQLTEIAKSISHDARVWILDEPSTALSVTDVDRLFDSIRAHTAQGNAVIYVSHRMDEISEISDRLTILRDGRKVTTAETRSTSVSQMIEHIVGKKARDFSNLTLSRKALGAPVLELDALQDAHKLQPVSLSLREGEVVGLAGLLGSGRSSLIKLIAGVDAKASGQIRVADQPVDFRGPADAMAQGIAHVPESRATQGIIGAHATSDNLTLSILDRISVRGLISQRRVRTLSQKQIDEFDIKVESHRTPVLNLSGGNQQKVVLGKNFGIDPKILLLDEPTAGIDIGAKTEIIDAIHSKASEGMAVIVASSELSELAVACDRFLILADGVICEDVSRDDIVAENPEGADMVPFIQRVLEEKIQAANRTLKTEGFGEKQ